MLHTALMAGVGVDMLSRYGGELGGRKKQVSNGGL
jgi:hypothetical protein